MPSEQELVEGLASRRRRLDVIEPSSAASTPRTSRAVRLADGAFHALVGGLVHENPMVRWWSVQHFSTTSRMFRAIKALVPVLDDPVPRVRRNAVTLSKPSRMIRSVHRSPMTSSALAIEQFMPSKLVRLLTPPGHLLR